VEELQGVETAVQEVTEREDVGRQGSESGLVSENPSRHGDEFDAKV